MTKNRENFAYLCKSKIKSKTVNTPASMDMEATMEITCTEGNAVAMVSLFGQHLSKKPTNKYILYYKIAKKLLIQAYIMMYNIPHRGL